MKLLFVCLGNIIRSPLAENLFRHLAEHSEMDSKYEVDSAGTSAWHIGEAPDARMRRTAARHGLEYTGRARQVRAQDLDRFDLVLAMDESNRRNLMALASTPEQRAKIRLLREFDPQRDGESDVPDPYYGGQHGFEETYQIVKRSIQGLLHALENGQS